MKKFIVALLTVSLVMTCFVFPSFAYDPYEGENEDGKVICTATIDDSFMDNVVAVEIKEEFSVDNKEWTKADFGEDLPIEQIVDNTRADSADVYKFLMNFHPFRQALRLTLSVEDKQVVLDVIKELEKLDFVYFAHPCYLSYENKSNRVPSGETDVVIEGKINGETSASLSEGDTFLVNWVFTLSDEMAANDDRVGIIDFFVDFDDSALELVSQDEDNPDDPYYAFSDNFALFSRSPYKYVGANTFMWNADPVGAVERKTYVDGNLPEYYKYADVTPLYMSPLHIISEDDVRVIVKHDFKAGGGFITGIGYKVSGMVWFSMQFRVKQDAPEGKYPILLTLSEPLATNYYNGTDFEKLKTEVINAEVVIDEFVDNNVMGDVDSDSKVTAVDSLLILQHSIGKTRFSKQQSLNADINIDGYVDSVDSYVTLNKSLF